jgi:hypothetical protein
MFVVCLFPWASAASHGCTAAYWLIVPPALDVPTLATRYPRAYRAFRTLAAEVGTYGRGNKDRYFCLNADFHGTFRDLLHAANLRNGAHGFTSLPRESVLRIFPPLKIRRLRPGLNPRTWVTEASTLNPRPPKPPPLLYIHINYDKFLSHTIPKFQPVEIFSSFLHTTKFRTHFTVTFVTCVHTNEKH